MTEAETIVWREARGCRPECLPDEQWYEFRRDGGVFCRAPANGFNWDIWCDFRPVDGPFLKVSALTASASEPAPDLIRQARDWISDNIREGDTAGFALLGKLASPVPASEPEPVAWPELDAVQQQARHVALGLAGKADTSRAISVLLEMVIALRPPTLASEPEPVAKLRELHRQEHAKLGDMLLDKSEDGKAAANWQGGKVNGIATAIASLANPVPTPDSGAVEAAKPIIDLVKALEGPYGFDDDMPVDARHFGRYNDFPTLTFGDLRRFVAALEAPWQKPGRAAQAQAGEKPDFPADEQSGETSHGAISGAPEKLVERCIEIAHDHLEIDGDGEGSFIRSSSVDDAVRAVLSAALSHPSNGGAVEALLLQLRGCLSRAEDGTVSVPVEYIEGSIAALSHPADGWRDIRTAPRDGSRFLAWGSFYEEDPPGFAITHRFVSGKGCGGWWVVNALPFYPKLWMPVAAPAAKPEGE